MYVRTIIDFYAFQAGHVTGKCGTYS